MAAPGTTTPPETVRKVAKLYLSGLSCKKVAEEMNMSHETVRDILRGKRKAHLSVTGGRLMNGRRYY